MRVVWVQEAGLTFMLYDKNGSLEAGISGDDIYEDLHVAAGSD